ncbi:MAG: adenylate kinase family protein [Candidatus Anstonellaceae archaeon]
MQKIKKRQMLQKNSKKKKKVIIITGVPGTGKTILANLISKKLGYTHIEINKFAIEKNCIVGFDKKFNSKIVNLKKLQTELNKLIKTTNKNLIIEGHLACELNLNADVLIIFRLDPFLLKKRLEKRGYIKEKIKENLEAEILDYCTLQTEKIYPQKKIFEFDLSNKTQNQSLSLLLNFLKFKKFKKEKINWTHYLLEENFSKAFL